MCDCSACHDEGSGPLASFPFHTSWGFILYNTKYIQSIHGLDIFISKDMCTMLVINLKTIYYFQPKGFASEQYISCQNALYAFIKLL
jgi:hypothetical protein